MMVVTAATGGAADLPDRALEHGEHFQMLLRSKDVFEVFHRVVDALVRGLLVDRFYSLSALGARHSADKRANM